MVMYNRPLVSVIIPTYNVEAYLVQCLDGVKVQTYENFECIIIIDGATDQSYEIAREYCSRHPKFKVFYQDNAGSGPARNNGVQHACGEFLCFIDPDDWVEPNYIESLVLEQQKSNYDLVISQTIDVHVNKDDNIVSTKRNSKNIITLFTQEDCRLNFPKVMFVNHLLDGPICKLFRTSIIKNNGIEFPPYRRSQDMVFNFRYYNYIHSLSVISDYTYNIRYEYPPRPNRGRVFTEYHVIVGKIFDELSTQIQGWFLQDYKADLCTWSFSYICACLYRYVPQKVSIDFINDEPYQTIIKESRPCLPVHKLLRCLIVMHMTKLLKLFIKIKVKQNL